MLIKHSRCNGLLALISYKMANINYYYRTHQSFTKVWRLLYVMHYFCEIKANNLFIFLLCLIENEEIQTNIFFNSPTAQLIFERLNINNKLYFAFTSWVLLFPVCSSNWYLYLDVRYLIWPTMYELRIKAYFQVDFVFEILFFIILCIRYMFCLAQWICC